MWEVLRSFTLAYYPNLFYIYRSRNDPIYDFSCKKNILIENLEIIYELNRSPSFRGSRCAAWSGTFHLVAPATRWHFGNIRKRVNPVNSAYFNSALTYQEAEINTSHRQGEEELDGSAYEYTFINMDEFQERIKSAAPSGLATKISVPDTKLHFLEEMDEDVLSRRILQLGRSNKVRGALELYISMDSLGLVPSSHACNSLIASLLRNGLLEDALRIFMHMTENNITSGHTFSLILKAVALKQGFRASLKLFWHLEEGGKLNNFDVVAYNTMISICAKAKDWMQMENIWRRLKGDGYIGTTVTYSLLVCNFVRSGQTELAIDAYNEMINSGLKPGLDTMKAMVGACSKEGKWDLSLSVLNQMLDCGLKPNDVAYNSVINCLGKAGKVDLAFRVYNLMKSSGLKPDAYTWNALLDALYRGCRYADALQLFDLIRREDHSELNAHLYNVALKSCRKLALWDRSLQLIWQMEANGLCMLAVSYNHAISACEAARKPKVALQIYKHMIHKKCAPDTFTYLSLVRACIWGSLWVEAKEIIERATPGISLSSLYNALLQGMCLQGQSAMAKKLYIHMRNRGLKLDGKTRALMLQHLKKGSS